MPKRRALPYRFHEERLELDVTDVTVGGGPLTNRIQSDRRVVELQDRRDWSEGAVHLEARVHEGAAEALLPEDERAAPPWRMNAVLLCREAKWRGTLALEQAEEGIWRGVLPLRREQLRGTLSVRAFLTRTRDRDRSNPGYAGRANVRLASSGDWKVYVDDPQAPPGEYLDIQWIDFADLNEDIAADVARHVYYLDFGETPPVLYLNESVDGLKDALDSRAPHGAPAAVRDALFDSVAQTAWLALAMSALLSARDENGGEAPLEDWQKNVLRSFENRLRGRFDDPAETIRNPSEVQTLLEALTSAMQDKVDMRKSTGKLLQLLAER